MGTVLSLRDPNPGFWFKFDEDDAESGEVCIRAINQAKRQEIQRKTQRKKIEYKHGSRFEVNDQNEDLFMEMLWDYSISDWKGLLDDDGKPIECTTENKLFLMQNHVGFATFIGECIGKVSEMHEERAAVAPKNSSSTSSASKKNPSAKRAEA